MIKCPEESTDIGSGRNRVLAVERQNSFEEKNV